MSPLCKGKNVSCPLLSTIIGLVSMGDPCRQDRTQHFTLTHVLACLGIDTSREAHNANAALSARLTQAATGMHLIESKR